MTLAKPSLIPSSQRAMLDLAVRIGSTSNCLEERFNNFSQSRKQFMLYILYKIQFIWKLFVGFTSSFNSLSVQVHGGDEKKIHHNSHSACSRIVSLECVSLFLLFFLLLQMFNNMLMLFQEKKYFKDNKNISCKVFTGKFQMSKE